MELYTKLSEDEVRKIVIDLMVENGACEDKAEEMNGYEMEEYMGYGDNKPCNGYSISQTDQHGGEGEGDVMYQVWTIIDEAGNKTNVKVEGYYDSWNGTEWDGYITLVKPVEVMVIQWEKI